MAVRSLLRPKLLVIFPLLLLLVAAVACGEDATPTPTKAPEAPVVNRLKLSVVPPINQVTMQFLGAATSGAHLRPMHEFLVGKDRIDGSLINILATEWEGTNNFQTWRFKLQKDVKFHDGTPFTAKDFVLTWNLMLREDAVATGLNKTLATLGGDTNPFEIVNDHEFVINLTRPEVELPYNLSDDRQVMVYSNDYWDAQGLDGYKSKPVGTGPYQFVSFQEGVGIIQERVPYAHWRQDGPFQELEILFVKEDATRVAQLLAGEVHAATIPRALGNQVLAAGKKVIRSTLESFEVVAFIGGQYLEPERDDTDPLTKLDVRKALNLAVNREEINNEIFGGAGELQSVWNFSPAMSLDAYDTSWTPYPYDPAQAKELLAAAGYTKGFNLKIMTAKLGGVPELPDVAEALFGYWRAIGITPTLENPEFSVINKKFRNFDLHNTVWTQRNTARPTFASFGTFHHSSGIVHSYHDPFIEEMWPKFQSSTDANERRTILRSLGQHTYDAYATIPIVFLFGEVAVDPDVIMDYKSNIGSMGPLRDVQFIEPVLK